jgi:integrase
MFTQALSLIGDKVVEEVTRVDGRDFIAKLTATGVATATTRRRVKAMHAILAKYFDEKDIARKNPFAKLEIVGEGEDTEVAIPYSKNELDKLIAAAKAIDDDPRWLVAIVADTGARLSEVAGLALADIHLDGPVPYVDIRPHPWRRLKNVETAREVPLVGAALWAAKRVNETSTPGQSFAFPRYNKTKLTAGDSASALLNGWIKGAVVGLQHTVHELRHTMADRLRNVQCPADVRFAIGGWARPGVGEGYGKGYRLEVKAEWLSKV